MAKQRIHNEWFQPIAKTSCPCGARKTQVYSWGEYAAGKWRTVDHFCQACFVTRVQARLAAHAAPCGCTFQLNARTGYGPLPNWLVMPEESCAA